MDGMTLHVSTATGPMTYTDKRFRFPTMLAFVSLISCSGCGPAVAPLNFSVPDVSPSATKIQAEVRSLTVSIARPDEAQGVLRAGQETLTPIWKSALEEGLNHAAIFVDDAPTKVSIGVKILKINVPAFGTSVTTRTAANYEIINRATGATLYSKQMNSEGFVSATYAFLGLARARESVNRSVQNNIKQFIEDLEKPGVGNSILVAPPS